MSPLVVFGFLVVLALFLAARSLVLWYWKIDKGIALLERQTQLLEEHQRLLIKLVATQTVALREGPSASPPPPPPPKM